LSVATLPVPFLIAAGKSRLARLSGAVSGGLVHRPARTAAGAFTGLVWLVIFLSDQVLRIVGIDVIDRLTRQHELVPSWC
jgi:hypothetical protein